jgi:hypothetical protein
VSTIFAPRVLCLFDVPCHADVPSDMREMAL